MGILQSVEIFCQAPSAFYLGNSYRYTRHYQGSMKLLGDSIFSLGMSIITCPAALSSRSALCKSQWDFLQTTFFPKAWCTLGLLSRQSRSKIPKDKGLKLRAFVVWISLHYCNDPNNLMYPLIIPHVPATLARLKC